MVFNDTILFILQIFSISSTQYQYLEPKVRNHQVYTPTFRFPPHCTTSPSAPPNSQNITFVTTISDTTPLRRDITGSAALTSDLKRTLQDATRTRHSICAKNSLGRCLSKISSKNLSERRPLPVHRKPSPFQSLQFPKMRMNWHVSSTFIDLHA